MFPAWLRNDGLGAPREPNCLARRNAISTAWGWA